MFFANILKEMGLIQDVVSDRELVRALYFELLCPDLISIYSYIEICLGGRVHLKEAYNKISK